MSRRQQSWRRCTRSDVLGVVKWTSGVTASLGAMGSSLALVGVAFQLEDLHRLQGGLRA